MFGKKKKKRGRKKERRERKEKSKPTTYQRLQNKTEKCESMALPSTTACGLRFPFRGVMAAAVTGLEGSWSCLQQGEKNTISSGNGNDLLLLHKLSVFRAEEAICKTPGALVCALTVPCHLQWVIPPPHSQTLLPPSQLAWEGRNIACPSPVPCKSHSYKHSHLPPSTRLAGRQFPCSGSSVHIWERKTG